MLIVIPSEPFGQLGALLSALIVVFALVGLTMHKDVYAHIPRRDFFVYYTNVSNLLVLLYFSLIAPLLYAKRPLRGLIPHVEFSLTMSIMLTHIVFHFLLYPQIRAQYETKTPTRELSIVRADNRIIHYIVPWLVFAYWLLCAPLKAELSLADAFLWTLLPILYLLAILLSAPFRSEIEEVRSRYPYPFLDVGERGLRSVLATCCGLFALCLLAGTVLIGALRIAIDQLGVGHLLILI